MECRALVVTAEHESVQARLNEEFEKLGPGWRLTFVSTAEAGSNSRGHLFLTAAAIAIKD